MRPLGHGRRGLPGPRGVLVLGALALLLTALLSPWLLPRPAVRALPPGPAAPDPRASVRVVGQVPAPARTAGDGDVAAALRAAGALSGPLAGRPGPPRFLDGPGLPPPADGDGPAAAEPAGARPGVAEPVSTASVSPRAPLPTTATPGGASPLRPRTRATARPEGVPAAARPRPTALAARNPRAAARPGADGGDKPAPEKAWTLPRSLLPTDP